MPFYRQLHDPSSRDSLAQTKGVRSPQMLQGGSMHPTQTHHRRRLAASLIGLSTGVMALQRCLTRNRKGPKAATAACAGQAGRSEISKARKGEKPPVHTKCEDVEKQDSKAAADDAYPRWQDRTRSGLEFENNLLIGLSGGLLVVTLGFTRYTLAWQRLLLGIGFIFLGLSVVVGIWLAANRLQSARLTARLVRIRQQRDLVFPLTGPGQDWRGPRLKEYISGLDRIDQWTRNGIRNAARECERRFTRETVNALINQLRVWTQQKADPRSWLLLRAQLILFGLGAVLIVVVPISTYFRAL